MFLAAGVSEAAICGLTRVPHYPCISGRIAKMPENCGDAAAARSADVVLSALSRGFCCAVLAWLNIRPVHFLKSITLLFVDGCLW